MVTNSKKPVTISPLAGKPAPKEMLVDLARLEREYYHRRPDPGNRSQMVSFGTAGHRGTSLRGTFTEAHILAITQASSSDFTKNQIHDRGTINGVSWEGFNWVEIADVIAEDGTTLLQRMLPVPSYRQCIVFHPLALGLSIGKEINTQFDVRPDLQSRPTQIRTSMIKGAVRVWEGAVVEVRALEN